MRNGLVMASAALVLIGLRTDPALAADEPVALVEDVIGAPDGIDPMDYLAMGRVLHFKAKEGVIISYLGSCVRERIIGGRATIGTQESAVAGGTVQRDKVPCDGGRLRLSTEQAAKSGVVVFRAPPRSPQSNAEQIERTLYGLSPLVDIHGGGKLVIERLDQPNERLELDLPAARLVRGAFYDFDKAGLSLVAGATYRASANDRSVVFKVDPFAQPGQAPLAGRLLRF